MVTIGVCLGTIVYRENIWKQKLNNLEVENKTQVDAYKNELDIKQVKGPVAEKDAPLKEATLH